MAKKRTLLEQIEQDVLTSQPLADTLRKCVVLGGKAGSVELREWATRELRGYDAKDDAPDYRTVGAPILADVVTGVGSCGADKLECCCCQMLFGKTSPSSSLCVKESGYSRPWLCPRTTRSMVPCVCCYRWPVRSVR